ncbi:MULTISPECIES: polysaccharide biosynthesis/export family protein [unclassified Sinorhizobium]|uniref:polysaccharide biosynthesis/export family protein n=1 Tax=unclassified Sinorhizobium TaxID=2613772 RepID=UPI0035239B3F
MAEDYVLGPQDTLKIRVFEWRPSSGTAYEWVPLTGEFAISPAGNLSLPIIGALPAAGRTLEQVADAIGESLQRQIGLQKRPNASVEVSEYRPFFVTGMVTNPGKYSYSPGLTVVQALSMAGGFGSRDPDIMGLQRDAVAAEGDLRTLEIERLGLLARQSRVDAVLKNETKVTFPPELTSRAEEPAIARMIEEEQALFDTRQRALNSEISALSRAKVLAENQIETLKSKGSTLAKQLELANKDLESVNKLISQGLTISARQLGANQNLADLESRSLDVSLAMVTTQQDLAKLDQDTTNAIDRYRTTTLTEAADLRDQLAANLEKTRTARALLRNIEIRAPALVAMATEPAFVTKIDRVVDGTMQTMPVADNDPVAPGDVIRVEKLRDASSPSLTSANNLGGP